jgi:hypothetical protein
VDYGGKNLNMQLTFSCLPATYDAIERALSQARLGRYLGAAGQDKHYALRLYIWNARLCESFYLPTQICEVTIRNALHGALRTHHGEKWFERGGFLCTLPIRLREEMETVIADERAAYGLNMTLDHIVSGLPLGFWVRLLTSNYDEVFWPAYFSTQFPNKPTGVNRQSLYNKVEQFRKHRNKIAHHKPIFHQQLGTEYNNLLDIVGWVSPETKWFVQTLSRIQQTISDRPTA